MSDAPPADAPAPPSVRQIAGTLIRCQDPAATHALLCETLGLDGQLAPDGTAHIFHGGVYLQVAPLAPGDEPGVGLMLETTQLTALREQLAARGAQFTTELLTAPDGVGYTRLRDPSGAVHELVAAGAQRAVEGEHGDELPAGDQALDVEKVSFIQASVEDVWKTITDPELVARWNNPPLCFELEEGGRWDYGTSEEAWIVRGRVVALEAPTLLAHTWRFRHRPDDPPSLVTFQLAAIHPGLTQLTMTHSRFGHRTPTWHDVGGAWRSGLDSIKSLLETGQPLAWQAPEDAAS